MIRLCRYQYIGCLPMWLISLFILTFSAASFAVDGGSKVEITGITVGFNGFYKNGCQTPAELWIRADSIEEEENLELTAELESEDPDGTPTCWRCPLCISGSEAVPVSFLFTSGRNDAPLTVRLFSSSGAQLAERRFFPNGNPENLSDIAGKQNEELAPFERIIFPEPISSEQPIWVLVGGNFSGLKAMIGSLQLPSDRVPVLVSYDSVSQLPFSSEGFDAADLVVLSLSEHNAYPVEGKESLFQLKKWVSRGGKVFLFGNSNELSLQTPEGILADFIPGKIRPNLPGELRSAPALVRFVPKAKNLVMLGSLDSPYLKFSFLEETETDAVIELEEDNIPLLVRRPIGFGSILFFAADPQEAPLADWNGRNGLLMKIFASEIERLTAGTSDSGLIRLGYRDIAGQIRSALDRFEAVRIIPFSVVLTLMVLFVLVIGPLDWFVTHRLFQRPNLTWMTLPFWIFLFGGIAVWVGALHRTSAVQVNRALLTDIDAETGNIRSSVWGGIYSPTDLSLNAAMISPFPENMTGGDLSKIETTLSWFGLSGTGLGGMASPVQSLRFQGTPCLLGDGKISGYPVPVRSTRSFCGTSFAGGKPITAARLTEREGNLTGKIVNPWNRPIEQTVLLYGNHLWVLGTLEPGETELSSKVVRTDEVGRILLGTVNPFDGRMGDFDDQKWEKYSDTVIDPDPILRVASFYQIAGGELTSGLGNQGLLHLDASESIKAGRAVLFGSFSAAGEGKESSSAANGLEFQTESKTEISDEGIKKTVLRIYIPVDKE